MFKVNDFDTFRDVTLTVKGVDQPVDTVVTEFDGTDTIVWERALDYSDAFITEWEVENAPNIVIQIPCAHVVGATVDCEVDWGDGKKDKIKAWDAPQFTHTYAVAGTYTVKIAAPQFDSAGVATGMSFPGMNMARLTHVDKAKISKRLTKVKQLGIVGWQSLRGLVFQCPNLNEFNFV